MDGFGWFASLQVAEQPLAGASRVFYFLVFVVVAGWLLLRHLREQSALRSQAWQDLASEMDFSYKPANSSALRHRSEEVEGVVDGTVVRLSRYFLSPGLDSAVYTRWTATLEPRPDFVLYVHAKQTLTRLAAYLGFEEISLSDPDFERFWSTKSDEPQKAKRLLNEEARKAIQQLRSGCVVLNDTGIHVIWSGPLISGTELRHGLQVLKQLLPRLTSSGVKPADSPTPANSQEAPVAAKEVPAVAKDEVPRTGSSVLTTEAVESKFTTEATEPKQSRSSIKTDSSDTSVPQEPASP